MTNHKPYLIATNTYEAAFHHHFDAVYAEHGFTFTQCAPAYHYGYDLAVDRDLKHKTWEAVESEAKHYWRSHNHSPAWAEIKDAVQFAWLEVRVTEWEAQKLPQLLSLGQKPSFPPEVETAFHRDYEANYAVGRYRYQDYARAYGYGYRLGADERLGRVNWADIELMARHHWGQRSEVVPWDKAKAAIQFAWNQAQSQKQK
jgi:hypothetical protein